jgi:hypothetical protein
MEYPMKPRRGKVRTPPKEIRAGGGFAFLAFQSDEE